MKHIGLKQIHLVSTKSAHGEPESGDLALINNYTMREHASDELYVRTMYLAHNGIDRDREVISQDLMDDFVRTLPGKGLFVKHPMSYDGDSGPGEGRFFKANKVTMSQDEARQVLREPNLKFIDDSDAILLEASFYMARTDENKNLIAKIDAGVAGDVSIGFSSSRSTPVKDEYENVIADMLNSPGQAYEGSLVWLGAQPGARIVKSASFEDDEENPMDLKQQFDQLQEKHNALNDKYIALKESADVANAELTQIKEALGDSSIADLKEMAELGKSYKAGLIDDVVASERLAGLIEGDDAETVNQAKALYQDWDVSRLKTYLGRVKAMVPDAGEIGGGDPGATGAHSHGNDDKTKDASNPFANKAVTGAA